MISLTNPTQAVKKLAEHSKARRLDLNMTQAELAKRAGVSLATLRKFEQQGCISLESFTKLLLVLDALDEMVNAVEPKARPFMSIDDVLKPEKPKRQRARSK